ncbi:MAG TPA: long-chain fatty acid--CoA ligase [Syntrophomonadaceae bacterium]|nr:long-chain fatty acid--CoA ligase [Syntrophomonadaceae bacterium]
MEVIACNTLARMFNDAVTRHGHNRCQWWRTGPETTESLTYTEVGFKVKDLAGALLEMGIKKGDRVAIMAPNCPEWLWADFAILNAGGTTVTIYPTSSEHELSYIMNDSGSNVVFVKGQDILNRVLSCLEYLPTLEKIIVMDDELNTDNPLVISIDEMIYKGAVYLAENRTAYDERWNSIQPWDWSTIVYTSGTTGQSKGAVHTHQSIVSSVYRDVHNATASDYGFSKDDVCLSFLPLSHTYEREMGQILGLFYGSVIAYCQKASTIMEDMQIFKPTYFLSVPRIFERIYMTLREMASQTEESRVMFEKALDIGKKVIDVRANEYGAVDMGFDVDLTEGLPEDLKEQYLKADELLFSKIRGMLGGRFRSCYSASAALSEDLCKTFLAMGIRINEGYGLTETCNSVIYNDLRSIKPGSIGKIAAGVEAKIAEDGELLVRGNNVFLKYINRPEDTKEAFTEDGFFKTGDIVEVDEGGFYRIVDRKKAIMVLDTGKNVPRAKVESPYSTSRYIEQIFVVGDDRKYLGALVVPKYALFMQMFKDKGIDFDESKIIYQGEGTDRVCVQVGDDFINQPLLKEMIEKEISEQNSFLERHEVIKQWAILPRQFLLENDEITPTLKTKVKVINNNWADLIEKLYKMS